MGCQFSDEPFRQRLEAVVFLGYGLGLRCAAGTDADNAALASAAQLAAGCGAILILRLGRFGSRLVLGTDVAVLDPQCAFAVDADERARKRDLGEIIDDRPLIERSQSGFDFAEPAVDLFGYFVGLRVLLLKAVKFGFQRVAARNFPIGEIDDMSVEPAQASRVAIGK